MMHRICRWVVRIFAVLYLVALALGLIGTFGWFGQERDPLSWVFIVPLGLPWNQMLDGFGTAAIPWLAALAPLLNIAILAGACRLIPRNTA